MAQLEITNYMSATTGMPHVNQINSIVLTVNLEI